MNNLIQKVANPQGKGVVGVVEDMRSYTPIAVQAKDSHQWLADYFTSTLVLSSKFGFKPVRFKDYYLYYKHHEWRLSLIEPQAWKNQHPGIFFAICNLNQDMSWSLELVDGWQEEVSLLDEIKKLETMFYDSLKQEGALVENLPFYVQDLPYYQRLGANALANSLRLSLELTLGKEKSLRCSGTELLVKLGNQAIPLLESDNQYDC